MRSPFWLQWLKTTSKKRQPRRGKPDRRLKRVLLNLESLEERIALNGSVTVSTFLDVVDGDTSSLAALMASPGADGKISLREAIIAANNTPSGSGTPNTINLPDGTYNLTTGTSGTGGTAELDIGTTGTNENTVIQGTSEAGTIINQTVAGARIFNIDPPANGSIVSSYSNLTLQNGQSTDGGGAVLFGGTSPGTTADQATFTNVDFKNNEVTGTLTNAPGGAINDAGGVLDVVNSTFDSNTVGTVGTTNLGSGSGAIDLAPNDNSSLVITGSTFINNQAAASASGAGGGAIRAVTNGFTVTVNISGSSFINNEITSGATTGGGAIYMPSGSLTLTDDNFSGNQITTSGVGEDAGGAVYFGGSSLTANFNRFVGNSTAKAGAGNEIDFNKGNGGTANIEDNWWGQNSGPAAGDNVQTFPTATFAPTDWLTLVASLSSDPIFNSAGPNPTSTTITAGIDGLHSGGTTNSSNLTGLPTFPASPATIFTNNTTAYGSLSGSSTQFVNGLASTTFTASATAGAADVSATADNQTVHATFDVKPTVTMNPAGLPADAASIIIAGTAFDTTAANNTVTFNDGAVGTVTTASANSLTVTFSTKPGTAGPLTAIVTTNGASSGSAVQVATVTPVVTMNAADLPINATSITIAGFGFDPTKANDSVVFNDGAVGSVTAAAATSLTVTFSTQPTNVGSLTAVVTTDGVSSGAAVQVATVAPVVTMSTANLPANATSITIAGFGFDTTAANDTVVFNDGAVGTVTAASANSLTVAFSTDPTSAGSLTAVVTVDGFSSGAAVQVATVIPVVTMSTASIQTTDATVTINGFGFDSSNANNSVVFNLGAAGTVASSSPTQLVVTFTTQPTTGNLTAVVTSNSESSGAAVQVATVVSLAITPSTADLARNAPQIIINGSGFSTTTADDGVAFDDGTAGNVVAATATQLTVTFTTQPTALGALNATVTVVGNGSTGPTEVANIVAAPTVMMSTANLPINAATITIGGTGFSTTAANDSVVFNDGAVGTVTTASANSLTVTFTTPPSVVGSLTAVVTANGGDSGPAVQVATVVPVVTMDATNLPANATTITIAGFGFDPTAANDSVVFNDGAVGTVTTASATSLTVTFTTSPTTAGSLTAVVTADGIDSGAAVQVATVTPVVTMNTTNLPANATTITIAGFGFDPTAANDSVVFNDGAVGTVTTASATSLTVTFTTSPTTAGSLTAVVTADGIDSGAAVQVATVTPVVTMNTTNLPANATTITIAGFGFDPTAANDSVVFNDGAVGTVTSASAASLTVTFTTGPTTAGSLTAVVTTDGIDSGAAVQVATVTPVVTMNTTNLPANATTITIAGFGFDPTAANDSVVFNDGAVGTVTTASATSLTVTFTTSPTPAGILTAVVTTDGVGSGAAVQVATVTPVVTMNTSNLAANATGITIGGVGFDSTAANNTITFNDGAVGTVTTASATSLTVTFTTPPAATGPLTAVVTTDGISSGAAVQVATIVAAPTLTSINPTSATAGDNATVVTVNGTNFINGFTTVDFNGTPVTTTFVNGTKLTAVIPAADLTTAGPDNVTVVAPGGSTTAAKTFTVNPAPTLTSISPSSVTAGANDTTITLMGTNFVSGFTADFNGVLLATTFVNATKLMAVVPAADLTTAGPNSVTVVAPGGSATAAQTFTVNNPLPTLASINPTSAAAGDHDTTITLTGAGFVNGSTADLNGAPIATNFVSATQLTAVVPAADLITAGMKSITVVNAGPGGGRSDLLLFDVASPPPPPTVQLPPAVSVAFGPAGEVLELVNSAGVLTQFTNGVPQQLGNGGVRSASVAYVGNTQVLEIVGLNGVLTQFINGVPQQLGNGGVSSASVAFVGSTEVMEVVGLNGVLTQFINGVPQQLGNGGVRSASVAYVGNTQVLEIVGLNGVLTQFTNGVAQQLGGAGVQSAGVAFNATSEVLDIIFSDGALDQFDAFGVHRLGMVS